jgi:hypothetical protein
VTARDGRSVAKQYANGIIATPSERGETVTITRAMAVWMRLNIQYSNRRDLPLKVAYLRRDSMYQYISPQQSQS